MRKRQTQLKRDMQKAVLSASLLLCGTAAMAQSQKSGVITDSNGEPLVGVTVMEQGTTNGTVTDANGRYTITTTKPGAKLKWFYGCKRTLQNQGSSRSCQTKLFGGNRSES